MAGPAQVQCAEPPRVFAGESGATGLDCRDREPVVGPECASAHLPQHSSQVQHDNGSSRPGPFISGKNKLAIPPSPRGPSGMSCQSGGSGTGPFVSPRENIYDSPFDVSPRGGHMNIMESILFNFNTKK